MRAIVCPGNPDVTCAYDVFCSVLAERGIEATVLKYEGAPEEHYDNLRQRLAGHRDAVLIAHSYGALHALRLHGEEPFRACVLVAPFLMRSPNQLSRWVLWWASWALVRWTLLWLFTLVRLAVSEGLFVHLFGAGRGAVPPAEVERMLRLAAWEADHIDSITEFDPDRVKHPATTHLTWKHEASQRVFWADAGLLDLWPGPTRTADAHHAFPVVPRESSNVAHAVADALKSR
ncbi:unnamed protein product [Prorocentrum cordatum]|uniref:AB hydrolase-1 domain-containing protein n=1 Tax=Prorocentrum cordatum TaxID=2364126 RepID=A0ABN9TBJ9_9DINO|nr:unnamed protein product [Polarella glacialis]